MKVLEINPRSPLIEGLLKRVEQLPGEDEERDLEAEDELREVTSVLIDGALVRSGFEVPDSHSYVFPSCLPPLPLPSILTDDYFFNCSFFTRVDRILRRSLGVSETAPTDDSVKPAPPVDPSLPTDEELAFDDTHVPLDPELLGLKVGEPVLDDGAPQVVFEAEEVDDVEEDEMYVGHDEL